MAKTSDGELREIPELDLVGIRNGLSLREEDPVPTRMVELYWEGKKHWDHVAHGMQMPLSVCWVMVMKYWNENSSQQKPAANDRTSKKPKARSNGELVTEATDLCQGWELGHPVRAKFRAKWHPGKFRGVTNDGKNVKVLLDDEDNAEERELKPHNVKPGS